MRRQSHVRLACSEEVILSLPPVALRVQKVLEHVAVVGQKHVKQVARCAVQHGLHHHVAVGRVRRHGAARDGGPHARARGIALQQQPSCRMGGMQLGAAVLSGAPAPRTAHWHASAPLAQPTSSSSSSSSAPPCVPDRGGRAFVPDERGLAWLLEADVSSWLVGKEKRSSDEASWCCWRRALWTHRAVRCVAQAAVSACQGT